MRVPRGVDARRLIEALQADGLAEARVEGSHHRYKHSDDLGVTIAYHKRSDTFAIKTLVRMIEAARWTEPPLCCPWAFPR